MQLDELNEALDTKGSNSEEKKTILVSEHKSARTSGPANIHMSVDLCNLVCKYVRYVRVESASPYVFLTASGNAISSSCCWGIFGWPHGEM